MHALAPESLKDQQSRLTGEILVRIRAKRPRIHCITNAVAQNFTANVLLAAGAIPSMTLSVGEIADFVRGADALLVNLGTFDQERREAVEIAIGSAAESGRPWVLDPVFVDRSGPRTQFAKALMGKKPAIVRLNAAEFTAIANAPAAEEPLRRFALDHGCVAALSGAVDIVTDGARTGKIENGDSLMARVTAMGCAGTALVAACLAVESDPWLATVGGLLAFAVAGECAAARARGPGSFAVEIVDAVANIDSETLLTRARVS
jgi:hydroxyethylthiazole kinase